MINSINKNTLTQNSFANFAYNGMELDNEVSGVGNSYDFGARMYNSRLGMWFSIDPLASKYPGTSPFIFALNNPIICIDPDGERVKPMSKEALEAIRNSLSPDDASKIKVNWRGYIKERPIRAALKISNSQNLKDLHTLIVDKRVLEVYTSNEGFESHKTSDNTKQFEKFDSPKRFNPAVELYNSNKDQLDKIGISKEQYFNKLKEQGIKNEEEVNGNFGATIFDENEANKAGSVRYSNNGKFQVYINTNGTTKREQAMNWAHEGLGHLLFQWMGKKSGHTGLPNSENANKPLEYQIKDRQNEAGANYDKRNN